MRRWYQQKAKGKSHFGNTLHCSHFGIKNAGNEKKWGKGRMRRCFFLVFGMEAV